MNDINQASDYNTDPVVEDVEIIIPNSEGSDVVKNYQTSQFNNGWGALHKDFAHVEQKVIENRIVTYISFNKNKKKIFKIIKKKVQKRHLQIMVNQLL